jgi:hypothetical protein
MKRGKHVEKGWRYGGGERVCVYVYMCVYVCACMCICMCVYLCVYVCMHVCMLSDLARKKRWERRWKESVCVCVCVYMCMRDGDREGKERVKSMTMWCDICKHRTRKVVGLHIICEALKTLSLIQKKEKMSRTSWIYEENNNQTHPYIKKKRKI